MPTFPAFTLTAQGQDMQAQAETGLALTFSRIALGAGVVGSPSTATALADQRMTSNVQAILNMGSGSVRVRAVFTNSALSVGFSMSEVGVFALDPTTHVEKLYSYTSTATPDFMPSSSSPALVEQIFDAIIAIGSAANVTASINDTVMIATRADLPNVVVYDSDVTAQTSVTISSSTTIDLLPLSAAYRYHLSIYGSQTTADGNAKLQPDGADTNCVSFSVSLSGGIGSHSTHLNLGQMSIYESIMIEANLGARCGSASAFDSKAIGSPGTSNIGVATFGRTKTNYTSLKILFEHAFTGHIRLIHEH
jgi:hypothetical protein